MHAKILVDNHPRLPKDWVGEVCGPIRYTYFPYCKPVGGYYVKGTVDNERVTCYVTEDEIKLF